MNAQKIQGQLSAELADFVARVTSMDHLLEILAGRSMLAWPSIHESDRTVELQLLEREDDRIHFVIFSDGPGACLGLGAVATPTGVIADSLPRLWDSGVPGREIHPLRDLRK